MALDRTVAAAHLRDLHSVRGIRQDEEDVDTVALLEDLSEVLLRGRGEGVGRMLTLC